MNRVQYILHATRPYQMVFCVFGIAPCPTTGAATIDFIYSILFHIYKVFLIGAALFITVERCKFAWNADSNDFLSNGLQIAQFIALTMVQSVMYLVVFLKYNDLKRIYSDINAIDQDVLYISNQLSVPCSRYKFKKQLLRVPGVMLLIVSLSPLSYLYIIQSIPALHWGISIFSEVAVRFKGVEFCILVQVFNELLNELLACLRKMQYSFHLTHDRFSIEHFLVQRRIVSIQNLQSKLWETVHLFTEYFAITILCELIYIGLSITNVMFYVYALFNNENNFANISRLLLFAFFVLDIVVPCYLCDTCVQTHEKIIRLIHGFTPTDADMHMKMSLREYSLQLTHQKLVFSCGGYLDINLQCFGEIILAITTYIVILIQFKLQTDKI